MARGNPFALLHDIHNFKGSAIQKYAQWNKKKDIKIAHLGKGKLFINLQYNSISEDLGHMALNSDLYGDNTLMALTDLYNENGRGQIYRVQATYVYEPMGYFTKYRLFSKTIVDSTAFLPILKEWAREFVKKMDIVLDLKKFNWIELEEGEGYYSYSENLNLGGGKPKLYEICMLEDRKRERWVVSLCDSSQAVIREMFANSLQKAVTEANTLYHTLV